MAVLACAQLDHTQALIRQLAPLCAILWSIGAAANSRFGEFMTYYPLLKLIHILSSTLLFGTGLGSAFYLFCAHRQKNLQTMLHTARNVVIADFIFTTPAVIIQPVTGFLLIYIVGYPLQSTWIVASLLLYVFVGLCWLPVVFIQIKLHRLLKIAIAEGSELPEHYWRLYRWWLALGWPAFISVIVIFYLMVFKIA